MHNISLRLLRVFERLTEPVVEYPNRLYADQLRAHFANIRDGRVYFRSFAYITQLVIQVTMGILATPVSALFRLLGIRFISIDLSQVGSVVFLDLFLRENRLGRRTPPHKLIACYSDYREANICALDLYRPHITLVKNPFLKMILSPFFVNPFFKDDTFRFDLSETFRSTDGKRRTFVHEIWREHDEKFGAPLVALSETMVARGREMMAHLLPPGRKFVALHVRESGFYGNTNRVTRNADITTYEPAIRYLIDRGYTVVRMGDARMVAIDDMISRCGPNFIDYARSDLRSDFLDAYLCSQCDFFIGLTSGLLGLPTVFERPCCNVNCYNVTNCLGFFEPDLTSFKKFRYISDDSLVPLDKLLLPPFSQNAQLKILEDAGTYMEDNSADEILETVKEFVERDGIAPTPLQEFAKDMLLEANYSYGCRGHFSNTILKLYFPLGKQ